MTRIARLLLCLLLSSTTAQAQQAADVPYVPTPWNVVAAMLEIAQVGASDNLIDLGSGDGRIVIEAAKKHGTRGQGIELNAGLVSDARREAKRQNVDGKVSFVQGNLFSFDISGATVLSMYLLPQINLQLRPRVLSELKPGTRVVSHDFDFGAWTPDLRREIAVPGKSYGPPVSQIYLWHVPAHVAGTWRWQLAVGGRQHTYEARISQRFQTLAAEALVDGGSAVTQNLKLRGDQLELTLVREIYGQPVTHEFSGRIAGDSASGRVKLSGGDGAMLDWKATRTERGRMLIE